SRRWASTINGPENRHKGKTPVAAGGHAAVSAVRTAPPRTPGPLGRGLVGRAGAPPRVPAAVAHGQQGALRPRSRERQEDQLSALGDRAGDRAVAHLLQGPSAA